MVIERRTDNDRIPRHGNAVAKEVVSSTIARYELLIFQPGAAGSPKYVRSTRARVTPDGPNDDRVSRDRRAAAEQVEHVSITRHELLLLCPGDSRSHEYMRRTGVATACMIVEMTADDYRIAGYRSAESEPIKTGGITRHELLLLSPRAASSDEDVR